MTITAAKSIFMGVGGSLVLAVFCSTFIAIDKVLFIMPMFIAFNSAMTGYKLVESLKNRITNISLFSFVLGVGGGALTFVAVNLARLFLRYASPLDSYDLFVYVAVSGITSYLGARLAVRYFNL
jgi:uncharacterized membrane protein